MKPAKKSLRPRSPRVFRIATLLSLTSLPLVAPMAQAANYYWDGTTNTPDNASEGTGGTWDKTATDWDTGTEVIWADGNTAVFGNTTTPTGGGNVTLGVPISALGLVFNNPGYTVTASATNTLTLTGAAGVTTTTGGITTLAGAVIVNQGNATQTWAVGTGDTLNITGSVAQGAAATGSATGLIFSGAGAFGYSGTAFTPFKLTVNGGATMNSTGAASIPAGGTYTGIGDGSSGTLNVGAGTFTTATAIFLGNTTVANSTDVGTLTISGTGAVVTTSTLNIGDGYSNNANGVGVLNINAGSLNTGTTTGNIRVGNAGSGSGTINLNGGTLSTNAVIATGSFATTTAGFTKASVFNFNGGTLQATGTSAALNVTTANIAGTSNAIFDTNTFNIAVAANLVNTNGSTAGVTKNGTGTLTFSGINTYMGNTTVNAGILLSTSTNSLPGFSSTTPTPGRITVANGAGLGLRVGGTTGYTTTDLDNIRSSTTVTFGSTSILGIDTTNGDFTYGSNIGGSIGLQKFGANRLILTGNNTYTGNTSISNGTLAVGSDSALGTGTVNLTNTGSTIESADSTPHTIVNALAQSGVGTFTFGDATHTGALNFTSTTPITVGGTSTPSRSFVVNANTTLAMSLAGGPLASTISGAGSLTFNGSNAAITGGTFTVTNTGGVFFNSALGASGTAPAVNVTATGVVGGSGTIFGTLSLAAGTTLTPSAAGANSIGTLRTGALTLAGTTNLVFDLGTTAAGGSDLVAVTGNLTLGGTLTVNKQTGFGVGNYELFSYTGTLTNGTTTVGSAPAGFNYAVDTTTIPGEVLLDVTTAAAPEPSTWAMMSGGLGGLFAWKLRHKRAM